MQFSDAFKKNTQNFKYYYIQIFFLKNWRLKIILNFFVNDSNIDFIIITIIWSTVITVIL